MEIKNSVPLDKSLMKWIFLKALKKNKSNYTIFADMVVVVVVVRRRRLFHHQVVPKLAKLAMSTNTGSVYYQLALQPSFGCSDRSIEY